MSNWLRYVVVILFSGLLACRPDVTPQSTAYPGKYHLQGVYQITDNEQYVSECASGKRIRVEDTPTGELRIQCSLFDHPSGTILWVDLMGNRYEGEDNLFAVSQILRVERRKEGSACSF